MQIQKDFLWTLRLIILYWGDDSKSCDINQQTQQVLIIIWRLFTINPVSNVVNPNPENISRMARTYDQIDRWQTYQEEKLRIQRATLKTDIEREIFDLKQEFKNPKDNASRISEEEYESRMEELVQRQRSEMYICFYVVGRVNSFDCNENVFDLY